MDSDIERRMTSAKLFCYMERRVDLKLTALKHLINDQVGILGVPKFITSISLKDSEVERSVMYSFFVLAMLEDVEIYILLVFIL